MVNKRGAKPDPWYRIKALDTSSAEVLIYDEIDPYWGVSAATFAKDLAQIDADAITVRINSPGGDVYEGLAILNTLRGHRARVTTVIDGIAASAASFIAMAGAEVVICRNAEIMIHDARMWAGGNADEMRKHVETLDRTSDNIASIYAEKAGGTAEEWRELMRAETWFSAAEAVAAGLADRVEVAQVEPELVARFDLSTFNYAGRDRAPAPRTPSATEAEANPEGTRMTALAAIAKRLGLAENADDAAVTAALDKALGRPADAITPVQLPFNDNDIQFLRALVASGPELLATATTAVSDGVSPDVAAIAQPIVDSFQEAIDTANEALEVWGQNSTPEPEPAPATDQAPGAPANSLGELPAGVVAVEAAVLAELRTKAARGDAARAEQERAARLTAVDEAVRTGRIAPAQRASWVDRLNRDPRELAVLNGLAPVYPVGAELGHAVPVQDSADLGWFDGVNTATNKGV
ncbi:Clp protease [Nocardia brasiliensis]|uniref:ATP-dependent Clp protease proteolytic subunit n=1 Tax=Nocardia brasiliensis TaxID=37326 RepID=A0A6G9XJA5_NOCBR|nr:head maturation protease, ClpP-related [Nocardia brasiliensis]QIS00983.1 Clp protease [Nocardia brasiliensis]